MAVREDNAGDAAHGWLFDAGPADTEAGAIEAAKAELKARGITGTARLERPTDDKAGSRSLVKPKKRAPDWRAKLAKQRTPGVFRASEAMQAPKGWQPKRRGV